VAAVLLTSLYAQAAEKGFLALQGGYSDHFNNTQLKDRYHQAGAALTRWLPWQHRFPSGILFRSGLDFHAGLLTDHDTSSFIGGLGPRLALFTPQGRFCLDAGAGPAYLSDHSFRRDDFGGPLQFTSFIGVAWLPGERLRLGLRFQHLSNGGIYSKNPGMQIYVAEVGFRF
jgi:hypothetical protein